jgi:hypothetical protein
LQERPGSAPGRTLSDIALLIFTVAALPGYITALMTVDTVGHRKLQMFGFLMAAEIYPVSARTTGMAKAGAFVGGTDGAACPFGQPHG